jgi:acyl-coenzyme A synthetase/AMP-(fatty) acid ligase
VVDAAVIGIPVEKQTEIIKAFVQLKSTYSPSEKLSREILEYLGRHLETNKVPRELEFVRELPKTTTGKIRRSELKNREIEKRKWG